MNTNWKTVKLGEVCEILSAALKEIEAETPFVTVKHYKGKSNAYQRTYVIQLLKPEYPYAYMRRVLKMQLREMKKLSKGTNTKYLTLGILKNLKILIPSLPTQQKFAERIAQLEAVRARMETSRRELDALFASLQSRAFSGELTSEKSIPS